MATKGQVLSNGHTLPICKKLIVHGRAEHAPYFLLKTNDQRGNSKSAIIYHKPP